MKKVLFIAAHRKDRSPSQRFRFEQYFEFLGKNGYDCHLSNLLSEEDDRILYSRGSTLSKIAVLLRGATRRRKDGRSAAQYDLVFIQREAFMLGSTYFERRLKRAGVRIVFDFDDAIWLRDTSDANQRWAFLKNAGKTAEIIALSAMVFAGNRYLADYARQFNRNVKIVPTTIDTDEYQRMAVPKKDDVCIGWTGSATTIKHFERAVPMLIRIKDKYGDRVRIKVIGEGPYRHDRLGVQGVRWTSRDEVKELSEIDIGIMPLPDDEWSRGKCGLKGLQYMALGIPAVMSPVGVNTEIIADGQDGFLAGTEDEWVNKISALVDSAALRSTIGTAGRATVEARYSVKSQEQNYLRYFDEVLRTSDAENSVVGAPA